MKQAVCGYGRAEKAQVQRMVRAILALDRLPTPNHAADALAVAICHALAPPLLEGRRMIARLRGKPVAHTPDGLIVDVGGVGYLVAATPAAVREGRRAREVVARDVPPRPRGRAAALRLRRRAERELFLQLLSVNGVGPKVALAIVSGSPAADLRRAIAREDAARFQAIPGIGKKTAERIVLELKEKIGAAPVPSRRAGATS